MKLNYTYKIDKFNADKNRFETTELKGITDDIDFNKGWYYIASKIADIVFETHGETYNFYTNTPKKTRIAKVSVITNFFDRPIIIDLAIRGEKHKMAFKENMYYEKQEVDIHLYLKALRTRDGLIKGYVVRDNELDFDKTKKLVFNLKVLNYKSKEMDYSMYKEVYQFLTGESNIERLQSLCLDERVSGGLRDIVEERLNDEIRNRLNTVKEISSNNNQYTSDPYYYGYNINGYNFWTGYTGIAGRYWDSICFNL